MKPFTAVLFKESRYQGAIVVAMILFCFLLQMTFFVMSLFPETRLMEPDYVGVAIFVTALYAGAAAAISFSSEHDERTFLFLRSLPVSAKTILCAKTSWVLLGIVIVLTGNLLLALLWSLFQTSGVYFMHGNGDFLSVAILEAFVWGLFWSPRCRSVIHAFLATSFCASLSSYVSACCVATGPGVIDAYTKAIPLRLGIVAVVAIPAVFGMLGWFNRNVREQSGRNKNRGSRFLELIGRFPYPRKHQSPFFALLHLTLRQSQVLFLIAFVLGFFAFYVVFHVGQIEIREINDLLLNFNLSLWVIFSALFYLTYCGSIFAADQKDGMFRFLSRCAVSPRKFWWSRMLPFSFLYLPVLVLLLAFALKGDSPEMHFFTISFRKSLFVLFGIWLIPLAVGAWISMTVKRPIVAVALTAAGTLFLWFWMFLCYFLFFFSPIWTTLPICVALLIASRFRTADWLRERVSWRSHLKPLTPLFATTILIVLAIPTVRVYSIPGIPFQPGTDFAQLRKPLNDDDWARYQKLCNMNYRYVMIDQHNVARQRDPEMYAGWKNMCVFFEQYLDTIPDYDDWLQEVYELEFRAVYNRQISSNFQYSVFNRILPWERARLIRKLNYYVHYNAAAKIDKQDYRKRSVYHWWDSNYNYFYQQQALLDHVDLRTQNVRRLDYTVEITRARLWLVKTAVEAWHKEHGQLPNSIEDLVGTYLTKLPVDPVTDELPELFTETDVETFRDNYRRRTTSYQHVPGWPYVKLGPMETELDFLPGYREATKR